MSDTRNISQPSQGSEELGSETSTSRNPSSPSAGTDTQLHMAARSGKKHKDGEDVNDDEKIINNTAGEADFLTATETDE
ncbi:MAG: hypothetical protein ABI594_01950 [Ginsengibacter sp.]